MPIVVYQSSFDGSRHVGETLAVSLPSPNGDFLSIEDW